jgi:glycosyltransferase involved in cell wall biosynthesis
MQHIKISVITSLYRSERFLAHYLRHVGNIRNPSECEFILVHNDPTEEELKILSAFDHREIRLVHLAVPRESLYSSWNRGIKAARGELITIWNVDDIRFPDSLLLQASALDLNPDAAISYGDIYGTAVYEHYGDRLYRFPEYSSNPKEFWRSHLVNCFQMWRKSIHESVGYYDEQFRCTGDFDFQIRTAMRYPFAKATAPLGVYLENQPHKISSSPLQALENNIVYLRYGIFEKLQFPLLARSIAAYHKDEFLYEGKWIRNNEQTPFSHLYRLRGILIAILLIPKYLAKMFRDRYFPKWTLRPDHETFETKYAISDF